MARKKPLEQRMPDATDLFCALDTIVNPDPACYNESIIAYPDNDPREDHSESEIWMYFVHLTPDEQKMAKKEIRRFSRITGKEFMILAPTYCSEKGCTGHFKDPKAHIHCFPGDLNNCYLYISKASRH
ncbi:MAG: hypothetical protein KJ955_05750 [Nanoarchaeota archaeon]|nr:hypothetical protein [Nanoarchaeota archaeon]